MKRNLANKRRFLMAHGVECIEQDGELFAVEHSTSDGHLQSEWVNVTHVNIRDWMGY